MTNPVSHSSAAAETKTRMPLVVPKAIWDTITGGPKARVAKKRILSAMGDEIIPPPMVKCEVTLPRVLALAIEAAAGADLDDINLSGVIRQLLAEALGVDLSTGGQIGLTLDEATVEALDELSKTHRCSRAEVARALLVP